MGSGKGEEDFNSKEKSKRKFMQFFQVFMTKLSKYINGHVDVPAGDLGLGAREISFMYGKHKQLNNEFTKAVKGSVNYSLPFPTTMPGMRDEKGYQLAEIAQNQTLMVMSV